MRTPLRLAFASIAIFLAGAFAPSTMLGQASLTFSGGLGQRLHITLNQPVTYLITQATTAYSVPVFVFQNVGNFLNGAFIQSSSSTIDFQINGGAKEVVDVIHTGLSQGAVQPSDLYIYYTETGAAGLRVGDTVTLDAGSYMTDDAFAGTPPAGGTYSSFISDTNENDISSTGVASGVLVPEPSTLTILLGVTGGMAILGMRRHKAA